MEINILINNSSDLMGNCGLINEDFFDDEQMDFGGADGVEYDEGNYNNALHLVIKGGSSFEDRADLWKNLKRMERMITVVVDSCPHIISHGDIVFTTRYGTVLTENNVDALLRDGNAYCLLRINCMFNRVRGLIRMIDSLLDIHTSRSVANLRLYSVNGLDRYMRKDKGNERYINQMIPIVKEYLNCERPFYELVKTYKIPYHKKVIYAISGSLGKSCDMKAGCDLNKANFNTIRLFKPGEYYDERPNIEYHIDNDDIDKREYVDWSGKSEDEMKKVCRDALDFVISRKSGGCPFVFQQNGGFGGVGCAFDETFVYEDKEYIVTGSYEFESEAAHYSISKECVDKIEEELRNGYSLSRNISNDIAVHWGQWNEV